MQKEVIRDIVQEVLREKGLFGRPPAKQIAKRIQRPRPTPAVMSVFHPGVRKLEQALEQIRQIEKVAGKSSVFTVNSARNWVCGTEVKEKSGCKCILDTVKPEGLEKALEKADILVFPTFCFKTAAKVAQLINDSQETAIVLAALMQGKPVLAANDGFTLLDTLSNQEIRAEINRILAKLESYGMVFCATEQLAAVFAKMAAGSQKTGPSKSGQDSTHPAAGHRLVTAKDIQIAVDNRQESILLTADGMVTPLAKDQAKAYSIKIVRAETGK